LSDHRAAESAADDNRVVFSIFFHFVQSGYTNEMPFITD
jgi:hypothetical protein